MMMAQRLYEAGYITYMRTDSTNLSQDALTMVRGYISEEFGKRYSPEAATVYSSKENSQEAHEAIRPSDVGVLADNLKDMEADAQKLYQLIWRQFVACQMTPAQYDSTTLIVEAADYQLRAKGRTLRFDGWTKAMPALRKMMKIVHCRVWRWAKRYRYRNCCQGNTSPNRRHVTAMLLWLKSWKSAVLVALQPTLQLFQPFRIAAMYGWKIAVSTLRKWGNRYRSPGRKLP